MILTILLIIFLIWMTLKFSVVLFEILWVMIRIFFYIIKLSLIIILLGLPIYLVYILII